MAKKKDVPELKDWTEVDGSLRRLGEIDIEIEKQDGKLTLDVNELKEKYQIRVAPLQAERKMLESGITAFAESRKDEFAKVRSRQFNFGEISYRITQKIVIRSIDGVVAAMKALGLTSFLRIEEKPDKERMSVLSDQDLAKIGASRQTEDKLTITPNIDRIKEM